MTLAEQVSTIRARAGLSRPSWVSVARVSGTGAFELVQRAITHVPYAREGRVRHALLLRPDASVFADVLVVQADDAFLLFAEGPTESALVDWLSALGGADVMGLSDVYEVFGVDGPYAWEVMAGVLGPVVLGQPYLSLLRREDLLSLRAGKTGEYGYLLLAPKHSAAAVEDKLREVGRTVDAAEVGVDALDTCALESWHFCMRSLRESTLVAPLTPIELQLQWRVVPSRSFLGSDALRARREQGAKVRATCFVSTEPVHSGDLLYLDDVAAGEVMAARVSSTLGQWVGAALLSTPFAHPHLALSARTRDGVVPVRSCTASLVDNLSLTIRPHQHSYATRERAR